VSTQTTESPSGRTLAAVVALTLSQSDERDAQLELRLEAYREGWQDGARDQYSAGYAAAVGDMKSAQHAVLPELQLEIRRWHVCCRSCRLGGHRDGCTRCEDRTRQTFSNPHSDDYRAGAA
jgi:hypothetical protein